LSVKAEKQISKISLKVLSKSATVSQTADGRPFQAHEQWLGKLRRWEWSNVQTKPAM